MHAKKIGFGSGYFSGFLPVEDRQPNRRLLWGCPAHAVLLVGCDLQKRTGCHFDFPVLKLNPGRPFKYDHPLSLILVIPEGLGRTVTVRNDSLDTAMRGQEQSRENLCGQVRR